MDHLYAMIKDKKPEFSKSFERVANYFFRDPSLFAMHSAREVGLEVGVSETTIIRFVNELGFAGYREFQSEVQRRFFQKSSMKNLADFKAVDEGDKQPIKQLMEDQLQVIAQTLGKIDEDLLREIVDQLIQADRIVTAGMQSSYSFARWFAFSLDLIRGNTSMYEVGMDNPLLKIGELTDKSVFVAFSFHRYVAHTIEMAKLARRHGVKVIVFTDSPISPITDYADLVVSIQLPVRSTIDIAPTIFMILSSLISMISLVDEERFQERVRSFDSISPEGLFYHTISRGIEGDES